VKKRQKTAGHRGGGFFLTQTVHWQLGLEFRLFLPVITLPAPAGPVLDRRRQRSNLRSR